MAHVIKLTNINGKVTDAFTFENRTAAIRNYWDISWHYRHDPRWRHQLKIARLYLEPRRKTLTVMRTI